MLPVTDKEFKQEIEEYDGLAIVDFWAEWCGPCKAFMPILKEVTEKIEVRVKVMSMDIDENPDTPTRFGVRSIPTLMIFKKGKHIDTKVGSMQRDALEEWIKSNA